MSADLLNIEDDRGNGLSMEMSARGLLELTVWDSRSVDHDDVGDMKAASFFLNADEQGRLRAESVYALTTWLEHTKPATTG